MPNTTTNYDFYLPLVNDPTDQDLWGGYLNANFTALDTLIQSISSPTGCVEAFAGASAPTGWLFCFGQSISTTDYASLYAVIGTAFGGGGGNFNVPDLRGRVTVGKDNMGGSAANRMTVITGTTLGAAGGDQNLHAHNHSASVTDPGHTHTQTLNRNINVQGGSNTNGVQDQNGGSTVAATTGISVTVNSNGSGGSQNVQPSIIMNYIIKT